MAEVARQLCYSVFLWMLRNCAGQVLTQEESLLVNSSNAQTNISHLIEQQNRQITTVVMLALIPIVVAFIFIVFILYRQRREAFFKQKETDLKLSIAEVEIKALRAQINPHFIFNCLNSIHHYMHSNDIKLAGDYLVKFSQLIRHTLETSSSKMISLEDDLDALQIYIQLEQLRMNNAFDFDIQVDQTLDPGATYVPPMMIQPFVENSIWHGLNRKPSQGLIKIAITRDSETIRCVIEDNGKEGSAKDHQDLSATIKKTSLGMALINERLEVINKLFKVKAGFNITDITNHQNEKMGKRVELLLPFED